MMSNENRSDSDDNRDARSPKAVAQDAIVQDLSPSTGAADGIRGGALPPEEKPGLTALPPEGKPLSVLPLSE
jgi:hypothetical protein